MGLPVDSPTATGVPVPWPQLSANGASGGFLEWFAERTAVTHCQVDRVPLADLHGWSFDEATGNLRHDSGKFFVVEGLHVRTTYGPVPEWSQPIINQPEIGILGLLLKEIDGVPHCLVQAKMEPGNVNPVQISPTVQATRSNYTRVHRGGGTRYLDHFLRAQGRRVLVDVLQSEQGSWFYRKRNRNIVVQVTEDVPVAEDYHWLGLDEIGRLLRVDGLINMDTRTVLSCLPLAFLSDRSADMSRRAPTALIRSLKAEGAAHHDISAVLSWFTHAKSRHEIVARRMPLNRVGGWHRSRDEITHDQGRHFSVIGVTVRASSREVAGWDQPLLYPCGQGVVAFLIKNIGGVAHLLVHARFQAGLVDGMEMGPTVQCYPGNYPMAPPRFLDYVLNAPPERILYDTVLSEEGGRFYHAVNRYLLVEAGDDFPIEVPDDFCWVTRRQLIDLLRHSYYLNVEARSLMACLQSL